MHVIVESVNYIFLFIVLYFEVFLLITYFETRNIESRLPSLLLPKKLPSVSIFVPCWNEEATICKTVFSLLKLDYPKNLLSIFIIDDGSTDNTLKVIKRFARNRQIKIFSKENGGKYTALNFGLARAKSDLVGCLDADSFVHPQALKRIVAKFEDREIMAVTPAMKIYKPKNAIELIQKVEYGFGILMRKILGALNAIYVTPGPFSIFRREVFTLIGNYRAAHNTEDMEIAMRMHLNKMKIGNAEDAFVYTIAPKTLRSLYKQRLRWTYGFLRNVFDYRQIFFSPKYSNLGVAVLPAASFSIFSSIYVVIITVTNWANEAIKKVVEIQTVGLRFYWPSFDWFFVDTTTMVFLGILAFIGSLTFVFFSRKLYQGNYKPGIDLVLFFTLYAFLAPFWMTGAIYNAVFARETKWR